MGLPKWMQSAWDWTKTAASKTAAAVTTGAKKAVEVGKKVGKATLQGVKYVGKAAKPVTKFISKVADVAEDLPGMVGDVAGIAKKYLDKFNNWVDEHVPDGAVKDKMKEASSGAGDLVDKGEKWGKEKAEDVRGYVQQTKPYRDKAEEYARAARRIDK
jgi:hypothetical protein